MIHSRITDKNNNYCAMRGILFIIPTAYFIMKNFVFQSYKTKKVNYFFGQSLNPQLPDRAFGATGLLKIVFLEVPRASLAAPLKKL